MILCKINSLRKSSLCRDKHNKTYFCRGDSNILSQILTLNDHIPERKRSQLGKPPPLPEIGEDSAVIDMLDLPGKAETNGGKPLAKISSNPEKLMKLPSTLTLQPDLKRRLSTSLVS